MARRKRIKTQEANSRIRVVMMVDPKLNQQKPEHLGLNPSGK